MKVKNRLNELTIDLYIKYKRRKFTDEGIRKLFGASKNKFLIWKKENEIPINLNIRVWDNYELFATDEIERMKVKFLKYDGMGWKEEHTAEAMGMGRHQLNKFKKRYFPEKMGKKRHYLTDEQMAIAESNGVSRKLVSTRRALGYTMEEAISTPKGLTRTGETPQAAGLRTKRERAKNANT